MITAFSGGAQGADLVWEAEAKKLGLPITFTHYLPAHAAGLSLENTAVVRKAIIEACKSMGRLWPTKSLAYIQRNYLIVRSADAVFAIGTLQQEKGMEDIVRGGTGWGVQFAIHQQKPVFLYNQLTEQWMEYNDPFNYFLPAESIPTLTSKPALIGSRQLSKAGLVAIQQVLTQTKERNASYKRRTQAPGALPQV